MTLMVLSVGECEPPGSLCLSVRQQLGFQFLVTGQKNLDQWRIAQRLAGGADFGKAFALAEHTNEGFRIATPFAYDDKFLEDDSPGDNREKQQDEKNHLGDDAGGQDKLEKIDLRTLSNES